jgi:hypothetical protein
VRHQFGEAIDELVGGRRLVPGAVVGVVASVVVAVMIS